MIATRTGLFICFMYMTAHVVAAQSFTDASDLMPDINISRAILGASLVDVNSDGLVDIFIASHLYIQQEDGTFVDDFEQVGLEEGAIVFGGLLGDYNADGFVDLFYMDLTAPSKLYRNVMGMGFIQANTATGITDQSLVQGSVWTDFNRDGLLDLFVGIDGGISNLFVNTPGFQFSNRNAEAGIGNFAAYGVAAADFDQDGDMDIFLTQCFALPGTVTADNVLFENREGILVNVSQDVGIVDDLASWGTVWLDYNNDGWLDHYTVNVDKIAESGRPGINTLYRNEAGNSFTDVSDEAGVAGGERQNNIAVSAADFDNDGWVDLFVVNSRREFSKLYRNLGNGTFEDIMPSLDIDPANSSAVAVADLNNDGWMDIYTPASIEHQLYLNEGGSNHYLKVKTRGVVSNLFGVGARIDVYTNGMRQVREITAGDGMTSQNHNLSAHFGLGASTLVDSLVVHWPSGAVDRLVSVAGDQEITIVEQIGINNAPGSFALLEPVEVTEPDGGNSRIVFSWEASEDPEQDPLTYDLYIRGSGLDSTFQAITENTKDLPSELFTLGETYRWTVSASDGYSTRGTLYEEYTVGAVSAIEPVPELQEGWM